MIKSEEKPLPAAIPEMVMELLPLRDRLRVASLNKSWYDAAIVANARFLSFDHSRFEGIDHSFWTRFGCAPIHVLCLKIGAKFERPILRPLPDFSCLRTLELDVIPNSPMQLVSVHIVEILDHLSNAGGSRLKSLSVKSFLEDRLILSIRKITSGDCKLDYLRIGFIPCNFEFLRVVKPAGEFDLTSAKFDTVVDIVISQETSLQCLILELRDVVPDISFGSYPGQRSLMYSIGRMGKLRILQHDSFPRLPDILSISSQLVELRIQSTSPVKDPMFELNLLTALPPTMRVIEMSRLDGKDEKPSAADVRQFYDKFLLLWGHTGKFNRVRSLTICGRQFGLEAFPGAPSAIFWWFNQIKQLDMNVPDSADHILTELSNLCQSVVEVQIHLQKREAVKKVMCDIVDPHSAIAKLISKQDMIGIHIRCPRVLVSMMSRRKLDDILLSNNATRRCQVTLETY
jgi:hypothetical protein